MAIEVESTRRKAYATIRRDPRRIRERRGLIHYALKSGRNYLREAEKLHAALVRKGLLRRDEPLRVLDLGSGYSIALDELQRHARVPIEAIGTTSLTDHRRRAPKGVRVVVLPGRHLPRQWRRRGQRVHLMFSTYGMPYHVCFNQENPKEHAHDIQADLNEVLAPGGRAYIHYADDRPQDAHWFLAWTQDARGTLRGLRSFPVDAMTGERARDDVERMLRERRTTPIRSPFITKK